MDGTASVPDAAANAGALPSEPLLEMKSIRSSMLACEPMLAAWRARGRRGEPRAKANAPN
jgi:hypothetical protein